LPIFTLDFDLLESDNDLQCLITDLQYEIGENTRYIFAIEDFDRTRVMKDWTNRWSQPKISISCFLNAIDGVVESHGRILIITANNPENITDIEALVRPGRIDKITEIGYCTDDQFISLIENFYGIPFPHRDEFSIKEEKITPAQVIKLLQKNPDEFDPFWKSFEEGQRPGNSLVESTLGGHGVKKRNQRGTRRRTQLTVKQRFKRLEQDLTALRKQRQKVKDKLEKDSDMDSLLDRYSDRFKQLSGHRELLEYEDEMERKRKRTAQKQKSRKRAKSREKKKT